MMEQINELDDDDDDNENYDNVDDANENAKLPYVALSFKFKGVFFISTPRGTKSKITNKLLNTCR